MVALRKGRNSGKITLKDWNLPEYNDRVDKAFKNLVFRAAAQAIEIMFDEAVESGGIEMQMLANHADPLALQLAWNTDDSFEPYLKEFNLREAVEQEMSLYGAGETSGLEPEAVPRFLLLAKALRELAAEIDLKCHLVNPPK